MKEDLKIKINEEFKPAPQFKKLYFIYLLLSVIFYILPWFIPVLIFAPVEVSISFIIPLIIIVIFTAYWIPKYYESIVYKLTNDKIIWRRGVWFKKTGVVPYNRITNIDITQGPISRKFKIASLKIQTAGYSGQQANAEIKIEGMKQFEELREMLMRFVIGKKPVSVENYDDDNNIEQQILHELIKIRKLLETGSDK
jgi:membrane protein YdbS with pleckstrin-like domain